MGTGVSVVVLVAPMMEVVPLNTLNNRRIVLVHGYFALVNREAVEILTG
jgi:hypothetical protein